MEKMLDRPELEILKIEVVIIILLRAKAQYQ